MGHRVLPRASAMAAEPADAQDHRRQVILGAPPNVPAAVLLRLTPGLVPVDRQARRPTDVKDKIGWGFSNTRSPRPTTANGRIGIHPDPLRGFYPGSPAPVGL